MTATTPELRALKTWSHLASRRRRASEYEIVSTNLLWHTRNPEEPFDIAQTDPVSEWYMKYRNGSAVQHDDWDSFRDPDEIVYRTYNILQDGQENYVEGLLDQHNQEEHDKSLTPEWVSSLAHLYAPGRYLLHTVQMTSAYLMHMAPTSTISNCAAFQSADQLRWLSNIAYRTAELAQTHPSAGFGVTERSEWEALPAWQGFRELTERVLATWDWAEAFVALNLVTKPAIDEAFFRQQGVSARRNGDTLFALLSEAALRDSERSRRWSAELVRHMVQNPENIAVLEEWIQKWTPLADAAITGFCGALPDNPDGAAQASAAVRAFQQQLSLRG